MKTTSPKRRAEPSTSVVPLKPWTVPRVDRIDAGQAEVGTRASNDGAFSTS